VGWGQATAAGRDSGVTPDQHFPILLIGGEGYCSILITSVEQTDGTPTGKELMVIGGHEDFVFYGAFSPDGTRIVTTSEH